MRYTEYRQLVRSDLHRLEARSDFRTWARAMLFGQAYKYTFWMRTCRYTKSRPLLKYSLYPFAKALLIHYGYKFGIDIPFTTRIGSGFYIGHFSGIFVNENCVIGRNCNISQGVTVGTANRGERAGNPVIGDNVYLGPGAKVIGAIRVGDHAAIGANCVVTRDVPDHAVVVGVPGRVISHAGSAGYINRVDYDPA
jgi:serine O-acetyltransferase